MHTVVRKTLLVLLFLLVSASSLAQEVVASSAEQEEGVSVPAPQERRLFNFWSFLFMVGPHPCPPIGPKHKECEELRSGSSYSSSSSTSGANGYNGYDGSAYSGSYSSESSVQNNSQENAAVGAYNGGKSFTFIMLIAAAVAVAMAIAAVVLGQRNKARDPHALSGSVGRRMALFSNFADSSLCNNAARPQRVVEMTMSGDEDYKGMV